MDRRVLRQKKIGVLMGGSSAEREVSLRSGAAVLNALKVRGYNAVGIDPSEDLCASLKKERIDIAFIALHGGLGENGAVQGMLEVMGVPYTGSAVLASALAMDKEVSKKIFLYHGIPVPPFHILDALPASGEKGTEGRSSTLLKTGFPLPWVVKPASEGSSVGVEIVKKRASLAAALEKAFSYRGRVIVEQYIKGREVQIGILNGIPIGGVEVRPSLEFYSYEAKYTSGLTEYIIPPGLSKAAYRRAERAALAAHQALGCSGATRVDLIIDDQDAPYVLEVNTIPGLTETSLLPKIAGHAGYDFADLVEEIIGGAAGAA